MNLQDLTNEVLAHGFDPNVFTGRIANYLNDGLSLIANSVNYFTDEAAYDFQTVSSTAVYPWPADFSLGRSLRDTVRNVEMQAVTLREIDRSANTQGTPYAYALDGAALHLYPVPDGVYQMELRYWKNPAPLVAATDVPSLPADWHRLLWYWACAECYAGEDDDQNAQFWEQRFRAGLADFTANVKFVDTNRPAQVAGMWEAGSSMRPSGSWSLYGY